MLEQEKRDVDSVVIGQKIKHFRKKQGLTQEQLAEKVGNGCSNKIISRYEHGLTQMSIGTYFAIIDSLGISPSDLAPNRFRSKSDQLYIAANDKYDALNREHRRMIDEIISALLKQEQDQSSR